MLFIISLFLIRQLCIAKLLLTGTKDLSKVVRSADGCGCYLLLLCFLLVSCVTKLWLTGSNDSTL